MNSIKFKAKLTSFLNLSYIKDWSGKCIHCPWIFCDTWCPNDIFYRIAAGTNLKNETTQSNEMSRTWHKRSETSHFTQSKVTISRTQSNEISRSNETSRCDRCTRWLLSTMMWPTVVTQYQLNGVIALTLWPTAVTKDIDESVCLVAIATNKCCCTRHSYFRC